MQQRFELGGAGKIAGCSVKVNIGRQEHLRDDRFSQVSIIDGEKQEPTEDKTDENDDGEGWQYATYSTFPETHHMELTGVDIFEDEASDQVAGDNEEHIDADVASWTSDVSVIE